MRLIELGLVLVGVLLLVNNALSAGEQPADVTAARRVASPRVLIIAHRGDCKVAPENTLPAFASAVRAGADLVELDYYDSADGIPVVIHDAELDRTTDAVALWGGSKLKVASKNLKDLKLLDAGRWFSAQFAGTRLPTLAEALDTIQPRSMTLVERKGGQPATCVKLLAEKKLLESVVVQSFDWSYLEGCHRLAEKLVLAALGDRPLTTERLDQIAKTGARIVAWEDKNTDASTIGAIHARGWKAWVWTVDDPRRIGELVKAKIDGIITNQPSQARAVVAAAANSLGQR
jgi:glycerophosphoryl diester phosphodiesterase